MTDPEDTPDPAERLAAADAELARAMFTARLVRWELLAELLAAAAETRDRIVMYADGLDLSTYPFGQAVVFLARDVDDAYDELATAHAALAGDFLPEMPAPTVVATVRAPDEPAKIGPAAPPNELGRDGALVAKLLAGLHAAASEGEGNRLVVSAEQRAALLVEFVAHFGLTIE